MLCDSGADKKEVLGLELWKVTPTNAVVEMEYDISTLTLEPKSPSADTEIAQPKILSTISDANFVRKGICLPASEKHYSSLLRRSEKVQHFLFFVVTERIFPVAASKSAERTDPLKPIRLFSEPFPDNEAKSL